MTPRIRECTDKDRVPPAGTCYCPMYATYIYRQAAVCEKCQYTRCGSAPAKAPKATKEQEETK